VQRRQSGGSVHNRRTAERRGHGCDIELVVAEEGSRVAHRHTHVALAQTLGFELPAQRARQVGRVDEQLTVMSGRLHRAHVVAQDGGLHGVPPSLVVTLVSA